MISRVRYSCIFDKADLLCIRTALSLLLACIFASACAQSPRDSSRILQKVTVSANKQTNDFSTALPVQTLNHEKLNLINSISVADAAKYFSGVLIKDYGGVGGLKTISVRSLGALNTGILYDGVPVADLQSGQVDLGKFPSVMIETLQLDQAAPQQLLLPARASASAAVLGITTTAYAPNDLTRPQYAASFKEGSFGLLQPAAGILVPVGKHAAVSANAEALWDNGNYPYTVNNGAFTLHTTRKNASIQTGQGEINYVNKYADGSIWQTKAWIYVSDRALPGSIVFYNDNASQRLWDKDFFLQSRLHKIIDSVNELLVVAKYSLNYTRYRDPDFQNNLGGLDDRYTQQEGYLSAAITHHFTRSLEGSAAADIAYIHLSANLTPFATPSRTSLWDNVSLKYSRPRWQAGASLLFTDINDKTQTGSAVGNRNRFTTFLSAGYRLTEKSPFLLRVFYKDIFRMPTFNDLYYTFIGNITPNLQPEYSRQYNAGVSFNKNLHSIVSRLSISADAYYNDVSNKIVAVPAQNLFIWTMENIGKVHIKGVDVNAEAFGQFSSGCKWSARVAYTWQQALDYTHPNAAEYKNEIPYTPENSGSALIAVYYQKWTAGYSLLFSDTRFTLGENNADNQLPGWNTHDVFLARSFKVDKNALTIRGEINNLYDTRYDVVRYYPMPGRSYSFSIIFKNL